MQVDVAINYYGKPYQTLLAIESLLEHSGQHIDRIYVIREPKQPRVEQDLVRLLARYGDRVTVFQPDHYLGWSPSDIDCIRDDESYRLSIRYQYALEATDKRYLFVTHNDVLYTGDLVAELLSRMQEARYAGAGLMGVCWHCPARTAGRCDHSRHEDLDLSFLQAVWLSLRVKSVRTHPRLIDPRYPMPLPECKLIEYACLVDVSAYRRETLPEGSSPLFGSCDGGIDTACGWTHSMVNKQYRFANVNIWDYCEHPTDGHGDLFDDRRFESKEATAWAALGDRGIDLSDQGSGAIPTILRTADVAGQLAQRRDAAGATMSTGSGVDPNAFWRAQTARIRLEKRLLRGELAGARRLYWSAMRAYDNPVKRFAGLAAVLVSARLFAKATSSLPAYSLRTPPGA